MILSGMARRALRAIPLLALLAAAAPQAAVTFGPPAVFPIGGIGNSQVQRIFAGDFTGDGKLDLLVVTAGFGVSNQGYALVYPGRGDGTFATPIVTPIAYGRVPVVGDFNGDGKLDLAILGPWDASATLVVSVYLGDGSGRFSGPIVSMNGAGWPNIAAAADLNGDGISDLVVGGSDVSGGTIAVMLGTRDGRFGPPISYATAESPGSIAVRDLNGDGIPDVAVSSEESGNVAIHIGRGDGTFRAALTEPAGETLGSVLIGDFNGDGLQDIAVANSGQQGGPSVLLNRGNRSLDPPRFSSVGSYPGIVAAADFDRDGLPDLLASLGLGEFVLPGHGDGTFGFPVQTDDLPFVNDRIDAVVGDFNGDGAPDFALLIPLGIVVEINRTPPAPPAMPTPAGPPTGPPPPPVPPATARLTVPNASVEVGTHVRIPVRIDAAGAVAGVQFDLRFSGGFVPAAPYGIVLGPVIDGFGSDGAVESPAPGTLSVHATGTEPRSGPGTLATLDLFVPKDAPPGVYPMTVTGAVLTGSNGESVPVAAQAGSLTIMPITLGCTCDPDKITIADATMVLQWAVKLGTPTAAQFAAADVNKDGVIDIKDVTLILRAIVNGTAF